MYGVLFKEFPVCYLFHDHFFIDALHKNVVYVTKQATVATFATFYVGAI